MDYKLPPTDINRHCADILNDAPSLIAELEEELGNTLNQIDDKTAILTVANKDEKQNVQKALINSNEEIKNLRTQKVRLEALCNRWKAAQTNARAFYKSQNLL